MAGKLFDDMPSAPEAPRLAKDFPELQAAHAEETWMEFVQDPKMAIPILMVLLGLILIVVATKVFNLEASDLNALVVDSAANLMDSLAGILSSVTNWLGNLRN